MKPLTIFSCRIVLLIFSSLIVQMPWFAQKVQAQEPVRIMPLGNSITYGNYHPETRPEGLITGYRQSLWIMLNEAGYAVDFVGSRSTGADAEPVFDPDNEGYPGWRDDQIAENIYDWLVENSADVIILHIGTNGLDPDPGDVAGILDEIDRFEQDFGHPVKVILAKIINRSTYSQLTTLFNQNIEKMALDRVVGEGDDLEVIDMEFETGIDYRLTTAGGEMNDNLHPYVGGHRKMAERWFRALQNVLPEPDARPRFTSGADPICRVGIPFEYRAGTAGSPDPVFSLLNAPQGMDVDPSTGLLTWTPQSAGNFMAEVLAENSFGTDTQRLELECREPDGRVREGLIALYDFKEGAGNVVRDVSGIGMPNNLYINDPDNADWDPQQGLEVTGNSLLLPSDLNRKVADSVMATNEISLEAWIRTGHLEQGGPAHVFCISDPLGHGITLSQDFQYSEELQAFYTRKLTTTATNDDGTPAWNTDTAFTRINLQHLVYTRSEDGNETYYLNGQMAGTGNRSGSLSIWNGNTFKLALCNSLSFDHPWMGKLFLAAVYNRELTPEQVMDNYVSGLEDIPADQVPPLPPEDLKAFPLSTVASRLIWKVQPGDEPGFVIERRSEGSSFHFVASVRGGMMEFTDTGLEPDKSYEYRIKAINDAGDSEFSNYAQMRTFSGDFLSNVALFKTATQSSTAYGGTANLGVDGNTSGAFSDGSVTHTTYELNAWWEVDLEEVYNINYIEVWNRTDPCCKDRMARFNVFVSEEPFESYDYQSTLDQPGVWSSYQDHYPEPMVRFNVAKRGRYIRLQLSDSQEICLAELVAMGSNHLSPPAMGSVPVTIGMQGVPYSYAPEATDPDDDSLVFLLTKAPSWLHFDPATKTVSGTPGNQDTGSHQVIIQVYDGLYYAEQSFTLRIENVNDPPVIQSTPVGEVNKNEPYLYTMEVSDPDNDPLSFDVLQVPGWMEFNSETRQFTGTPANSDTGINMVTIAVSDGDLSTEHQFQVMVKNKNHAPVLTPLPDTIMDQNDPFRYEIIVTDQDNEPLDISFPDLPGWLSFDTESHILSGVSAQENVGLSVVTLLVSDGTATDSLKFSITVNDVNDLPVVLSSPLITVYEDAVYGYNFLAQDADNDPLTYTLVQIPDWLTFDVSRLIISGIPTNEDVGVNEVTIRVSDGKGHTDHHFQITVINVNDPPEFTSSPPDLELETGQPFTYEIRAVDVDVGDQLEFSAMEIPDWLRLDPSENGAILTGTPLSKDTGIHEVKIGASDGKTTTVQEFTLTVREPSGIEQVPGVIVRTYPVPADDRVFFEFSTALDASLKIYDMTGRMVMEIPVRNAARVELDITSLDQKLYIYNLFRRGGPSSMGKFIKK